jgi:hypothetical protein
MSVPDDATPPSDLILYQTEDGKTRIQCRFEDDNLWLTQAQIGGLYQKDVKTINEHLLNIDEEKELVESSTIRTFRIVRIEGKCHARMPLPRKPVSWFNRPEMHENHS